MKVTIDLEKKVVTFQGEVNYKELEELLKKVFTNDLEEVKICAERVLELTRTIPEIGIQPCKPIIQPYPWYPDATQPNIIYSGETTFGEMTTTTLQNRSFSDINKEE